jgi:hypothetical protein
MRIRMGSLCVHERTSRYGGIRADCSTTCHACGQNVKALSHLMFDCPATSAQRDSLWYDTMLHEICSVLRPVVGGAEKLRNVLALSDALTKLLRFISDYVWGSIRVCRVISRSVSAYLMHVWDVCNSCKHNGAVLPLSVAPVGRGADGVDAMACFGDLMMMRRRRIQTRSIQQLCRGACMFHQWINPYDARGVTWQSFKLYAACHAYGMLIAQL